MAIVRDYYSPEGCHIIVHDDYYINKTPEEQQAIISRVSELILREEFRKFTEQQRKQKVEQVWTCQKGQACESERKSSIYDPDTISFSSG